MQYTFVLVIKQRTNRRHLSQGNAQCAIFTTKRLIVRDAQGLRGKKVEIYSLPYSSIVMWSSENAGGMFDVNAEIELWTKAGNIKVNLGKKVDIRRFDKLIADALL